MRLDDVLPPGPRTAVRAVSEGLRAMGVRHVLFGGIAVCLHGSGESTLDIEFLVGPEGCVAGSSGGLDPTPPVRALAGARSRPVMVRAHRRPAAGADSALVEAFDDGLEHPARIDGIPVAPVELIVATKLLRQKAQDVADIVELAKLPSFDAAVVRAFVRRVLRAPLPDEFERMLAQAERERGM